jgi:hypothetical protein
MPAAPDKSQFDFIHFCKFVRLLDSDREGERNAALNQALKLCAENRPPLLFFEAAALAFGTRNVEHDDLLNKAARLQVEVDNLTRRLRVRESEAAELADRCMDAQRVIEQLIQKAEKKDKRGSHDFRALLSDLWSLPQIRLLLVTFVIICRIVIRWRFEADDRAWVFWLANIAFGVTALRIFAKWTSLQFSQDGLLQLLIKWPLFGCGLVMGFNFLLGRWPFEDWISIASMDGPNAINWVGSLIVLGGFSVLTVSRLSEWLVESARSKVWESGPVRILRRCF